MNQSQRQIELFLEQIAVNRDPEFCYRSALAWIGRGNDDLSVALRGEAFSRLAERWKCDEEAVSAVSHEEV